MTMAPARDSGSSFARPPGPRGNPILGNVLRFKNDTVGAIVDGWREHGDMVYFRGVGPFFPVYLVAHPDAIQYILAGASLVGVGTAAMRDPSAPERIVREMGEWCSRHGVSSIGEIVGALQWAS